MRHFLGSVRVSGSVRGQYYLPDTAIPLEHVRMICSIDMYIHNS